METQEYGQGWKARNQGKSICDCPFDCFRKSERRQYDDWNNGWMDRDYEILDQEREMAEAIAYLEYLDSRYSCSFC